MGSDDRIRFLAREEIQRDRAETDLGSGELTGGGGWSDRLDDLHLEIHALATKVAALEGRLNGSVPSRVPDPGAVPAASRPRIRKGTEQ